MSLEALKARLPDYAKDIRLNLGNLAAEPSLSDQQRSGCFVVTALATRQPEVIAAILAEFGPKLSPEALNAARIAHSLMAMNNIYYRFTYLSSQPDYKTMPAKLRMTAMANPGVDKADFELWALAVSVVNGCAVCVDRHEKVLRGHGITAEQIQAAARIAAVVFATAATLDGLAAGEGSTAAAA